MSNHRVMSVVRIAQCCCKVDVNKHIYAHKYLHEILHNQISEYYNSSIKSLELSSMVMSGSRSDILTFHTDYGQLHVAVDTFIFI